MGRDGFPWWRAAKRCWYVNIGGRQVRLHADKDEAFRIWHQLLAGGASAIRVGELVEAYLEYAKRAFKRETVHTKRTILRRLVVTHSQTLAVSFDGAAYLDEHPGWGRSTRWVAALTIKAAFSWAVKAGLLEKSPLAGWTLPGPLSAAGHSKVTAADAAQLIAAMPEGYRPVLRFLYLTGCRPCEAFVLEAANIDFAGAVVVLDVHKVDSTSRPRVIHMNAEACALVRAQAELWPTGRLFRRPNGLPISHKAIGICICEVRRKHGLPRVTLYSFRHLFATDALSAGVPDAQVAALLGHHGTATLHKHYSHLSERHQTLKGALGRVRGDDA